MKSGELILMIEIVSLLLFWLFCYLRYKRTVRIQIIKTEECRIKYEKQKSMNKNEIKKALYRQKPNASTFNIDRSPVIYVAFIEHNDKKERIVFHVPKEESKDFTVHMEAHLLIRWLEV